MFGQPGTCPLRWLTGAQPRRVLRRIGSRAALLIVLAVFVFAGVDEVLGRGDDQSSEDCRRALGAVRGTSDAELHRVCGPEHQ